MDTKPNHLTETPNQTTSHIQIRPKNEPEASNATSAKLSYLEDYRLMVIFTVHYFKD